MSVIGGDMTRRCLAAGLLDELAIDFVSIVLGEGVRLFEDRAAPVDLEVARVVDAPRMTHIRYRVVK